MLGTSRCLRFKILRTSHCHASGWARGRVDNCSDSGQTQSGSCRPWALSIRSAVCLPCVPALRTSQLSCFGGCATRGFPPSRAQNRPAFAALGFLPSLRSIRAAPHAYTFLCMHRRGGGNFPTPLMLALCVLLPYLMGRSCPLSNGQRQPPFPRISGSDERGPWRGGGPAPCGHCG